MSTPKKSSLKNSSSNNINNQHHQNNNSSSNNDISEDSQQQPESPVPLSHHHGTGFYNLGNQHSVANIQEQVSQPPPRPAISREPSSLATPSSGFSSRRGNHPGNLQLGEGSSSSANQDTGALPSGAKSPRSALRVRFPADNDVASGSIIYPRDDTNSRSLHRGHNLPSIGQIASEKNNPNQDVASPGLQQSNDYYNDINAPPHPEDITRAIHKSILARQKNGSGSRSPEARRSFYMYSPEQTSTDMLRESQTVDSTAGSVISDTSSKTTSPINSPHQNAPSITSSTSSGGNPFDQEKEKVIRPYRSLSAPASPAESTTNMTPYSDPNNEKSALDLAKHIDTSDPLQKEAMLLVQAHSNRAKQHENINKGLTDLQNETEQLRDEDYKNVNLDDAPGSSEQLHHHNHTPQVTGGVLSNLLKLYNQPQGQSSTTLADRSGGSEGSTVPPSGTSTPNGGPRRPKWYSKSANASTSSLANLVSASSTLLHGQKGDAYKRAKKHYLPSLKHKQKSTKSKNAADRIRITVHIAEILQRQRFILKLCKALMLYGAPTHRLEESMKMTARVLEIDGQFLYVPGCMLVSFGDVSTHTSETHLVKVNQGVNLSKLHDTHLIYKEVVHDLISVEIAQQKLDDLMNCKPLYPVWVCVAIYGFSTGAVGPYAYRGRWLDIPISIGLGLVVAVLQLVIAPRSDLYNNVFEISATIFVAFLSRAIGSIKQSRNLFCFAAIAQSALSLILPGYTILCGALELQSRNLVAGAVRMFYAVIYSAFLTFGITLGGGIYGWIDKHATSDVYCPYELNHWWRALFVPLFSIGLGLVNQARPRQLPVMTGISIAGYAVSYFVSNYLSNAGQLSSALGAFTIGVLGNLYSRVGHGMAFGAMLPAIFVQVPSGLAAQGSLIYGIQSADSIKANSSSSSTTSSSSSSTTSSSSSSSSDTDSSFNSISNAMINVAIGIAVGLFLATLVVYPFGIRAKRSGLFTF